MHTHTLTIVWMWLVMIHSRVLLSMPVEISVATNQFPCDDDKHTANQHQNEVPLHCFHSQTWTPIHMTEWKHFITSTQTKMKSLCSNLERFNSGTCYFFLCECVFSRRKNISVIYCYSSKNEQINAGYCAWWFSVAVDVVKLRMHLCQCKQNKLYARENWNGEVEKNTHIRSVHKDQHWK